MKLIIEDTAENYVSPPIHITNENLQKYGIGDTFIETGTYYGETVDMVARSGLFKKIHTIELDDELYKQSKKMFKEKIFAGDYGDVEVSCYHGDSVDILEEIVKTLDGPATFWLDAHASGELKGGKTGGSPLLDELDIIANSPIKNHTIIIDDSRLFGSAEWSYISKDAALKKIMEINPNYNILYLDGHIPQDVLWATVKG